MLDYNHTVSPTLTPEEMNNTTYIINNALAVGAGLVVFLCIVGLLYRCSPHRGLNGNDEARENTELLPTNGSSRHFSGNHR